jgi:hypothetical protein
MVYLTFDNIAFNAEYGDGKDYLTEAVLSQEIRRAKLQFESEALLEGKGKAEVPGEVRSPVTAVKQRHQPSGIKKLKVTPIKICRFCSLDHNLLSYSVMARSRSRERRRSRSKSRDRSGRKNPPRWNREEKKQQRERTKSKDLDQGLISASAAAAAARSQREQ